MSIMPPGSESNNDSPTAQDLRTAADVIEHEWAGWYHSDLLGWTEHGPGTPVAAYVAAMRAKADRLDGGS